MHGREIVQTFERTDIKNISTIRNVVFKAFDTVVDEPDTDELDLFKELVIGELLTNAVKYGRPYITVELRLINDSVIVSVSDQGKGCDPSILKCEDLTDGLDDSTHGRGLKLAETLSDELTFVKERDRFTVIARKHLSLN
ncbi:MAG: ATP-binding protein [Actinobacteria bacterium]|nr:ATP-binding protein [Actinomycetota bacterium]